MDGRCKLIVSFPERRNHLAVRLDGSEGKDSRNRLWSRIALYHNNATDGNHLQSLISAHQALCKLGRHFAVTESVYWFDLARDSTEMPGYWKGALKDLSGLCATDGSAEHSCSLVLGV